VCSFNNKEKYIQLPPGPKGRQYFFSPKTIYSKSSCPGEKRTFFHLIGLSCSKREKISGDPLQKQKQEGKLLL
jgi:hypothetical protein